MPAACAVCEQPISKKGEAFVLVGTEAVHRRCLGNETKLTRAQRDYRTVMGENNRLRQVVASRERLHTKTAHELEQAKDRIGLLETQKAGLKATVDRLDQRTDREREYAQQRDEARRERDEARRQLAAALVPSQLDQALRGVQPIAPRTTTPPAQQQTESANDDRDPTEVRFSLLELDTP